ncbi:phenol hydroxylase subunit P4 [Melaminivora sp.]
MAVKALAPYDFPPKDTLDKFPAPLLYIGWDQHMMFCAPHCVPMPPDTKFGDLIQGVLPGMYSAHPDFARIDWSTVQWFDSGRPLTPDLDKTMAEHGLGHKSVLRFRTPGLNGLSGSAH